MNIAQTTELAALIATHSKHVIESPQPLPEEALRNYWHYSRKQLVHWMNGLNRLDTQRILEKESEAELLQRDIAVQSIIEEIFVTEILTRVWTAVLSATDQRRSVQYAEPVARGVLLSHLQARRRALISLVDGHLSPMRVGSLNKLRRRCERWTDFLLGQLAPQYEIDDFAFDSQRAYDLGQNSSSITAQPLLLAGMRIGFSTFDFVNRPASQIQQKIISSVLASFPIDAFRQAGTFRSLSHLRIHRSADRESEPVGSSEYLLGEQIFSSIPSHHRFDTSHDDQNK